MQFIRWLWSDPETMEPVGGPIHLTDDEARRWFAYMIDPGSATNSYHLILDGENRPVGEVSFHRLDVDSMTAELNIKVAAPEREKGYARDALLLLLDYFFNRFGGRVLTDDVASGNLAGQQALLRLGFEHDPGSQDCFRLRMTREQYNNVYGSGASAG
jgi:RimJ/RimL family protein N-acetyltransferase